MIVDKRKHQQYEFIELVLAYEGSITNKRLREKFEIANVQASRVLSSYRELYPKNMEIAVGQGRGRYTVTSRFVPHMATLTIDRYFEVSAGNDDQIEKAVAGKDLTSIDPEKFRFVHQAILHGSALSLVYKSMGHPNGRERIIHPKVFVFAGRRWHVRAYDELNGEYRDFNLARMENLKVEKSSVTIPPDIAWTRFAKLHLVAHPALSKPQCELIRTELFDGAVSRIITVRQAMVHYTLRELEVATNVQEQTPPEYQLFLKRIEE